MCTSVVLMMPLVSPYLKSLSRISSSLPDLAPKLVSFSYTATAAGWFPPLMLVLHISSLREKGPSSSSKSGAHWLPCSLYPCLRAFDVTFPVLPVLPVGYRFS